MLNWGGKNIFCNFKTRQSLEMTMLLLKTLSVANGLVISEGLCLKCLFKADVSFL